MTDWDPVNTDAFLAALGKYVLERMDRGEASLGAADGDVLDAFKAAFRSGVEYGQS